MVLPHAQDILIYSLAVFPCRFFHSSGEEREPLPSRCSTHLFVFSIVEKIAFCNLFPLRETEKYINLPV